MPIDTRRVFRLALTVALALACGYAIPLPLPFLAPLFALFLVSAPSPPMGIKGLAGLILVVIITLGIGLLLIPLLTHYAVSGVLIVALGLFMSAYITINMGKGLVGTLLTMGFTLISAAGTINYLLAVTVIQSLVLGIAVAIVCQWLVYPWFPEDSAPPQKTKPKAAGTVQTNWNALRSTLIVLPAYLLVLTNPAAYMAVIMKSVSLGQQGSLVKARDAGRELLGSTFLSGCFAALFWVLLDLVTNLWMFVLWMLLFGVYFAAKLYKVLPSRYPGSFWLNTAATMLILLGPAVEDSANGKDVYAAFSVRMGLFVAVTLYAWLAITLLEHLRERHLRRRSRITAEVESPPC
ncbi:MAG: DUF2955 domain-containing protein [Chromatiaceae bacterium]|jgi:hypothetical protein|nr:DUF2955 domain-containing protein [Chromatiaceae bacterium]